MRIRAMAVRILKQMIHDRRTLMLILVAPVLLLTLIYLIFDSDAPEQRVGVWNAPERYLEALYEQNLLPVRYEQENEAREALEDQRIIACLCMDGDRISVWIDGSKPGNAAAALAGIEAARNRMNLRPDLLTETTWVFGSPDLSRFDNFGSTLIGFFVFFFVFLVSGIAFIQERTSGTLERLLSTPIRRWELITGYVLGYGLITVVQSTVMAFYVVYVLDVILIGSIWLVLLIMLLTAFSALTMGILISTAAKNEFQMVQFIPIIIVPQIFFSGLFDLSESWMIFGRIMPLYYVAGALDKVMFRGEELLDIAPELLMLAGYSVFFMVANTLLLKKYRKI